MAGKTSISGSTTVTKDDAEYASDNGFFQLAATNTDESPTLHGDSVDFSFSFWQGKTQGPGDFVIACRAASWSTFAAGAPVALRNLCGTESLTFTVDDASTFAVFDLSSIDGTVTVAPYLDGNGNGQISLTLDVPKVQLTSTPSDASSAQTVVEFSAKDLTGVANYADQAAECPDTGGDGCGCGSSGVYHPGGD
jgi:hypothetical protein